MLEQTDKQTPPEQGGPTSAPAAGTPQSQGAMTPEAVQSYLQAHPEAMGALKAKVKVDGREMEVPLTDVVSGYQLRTASQARFEEAARLKAEVEAEKAKLAERGDPINQLLERLKPQQPQQPIDPLAGLDPAGDPFTAQPILANALRDLYRQNQELAAKNKAYETKLPEVEKLAQEALKAQQQYEIRTRYEREFEETRKHNPAFTGKIVVDATGKFMPDYGDNPGITAEAIRLAGSDVPDPRLKGKSGIQMTLAEIADHLVADEERRVDERRAALAAAKQERLRNVVGIAPSGAAMPEAQPKTVILPTDDRKTIEEKTRLIRQEIAEDMAAHGFGAKPGF